jgi:hypothetical protein
MIVWEEKRCVLDTFGAADELADTIIQCEDPVLTSNASRIAQDIWRYIEAWKALVLERKVRKAFNPFMSFHSATWETSAQKPLQVVNSANVSPNQSLETHQLVEWIDGMRTSIKELIDMFNCNTNPSGIRAMICRGLEKAEDVLKNTTPDSLDFNIILEIVNSVFGNVVAELLEIIASVGLTLRFVDRASGFVGNRPDWLLVIAAPSSLKSRVMEWFRGSPYVLFIDNVTPASFLPADPEQEPLIVKMHSKVTLFPTLSMIAEKDEREAREIIAILERVYDGEYVRVTAKGMRGYPVDTVIIGAITPAVFERLFIQKMISYGSRFLIHRYDVPRPLDDIISELLDTAPMQRFLQYLANAVQALFSYAMSSVSTKTLMSVALTQQQRDDLHVLAHLLSSLRTVFYRKVEYVSVVDERTGEEKSTRVEEIEISQSDVPIRAFMQLMNFVRANAVIRKTPRFLGCYTVDDHAMRLATLLAISSSYRHMYDIVYQIFLNQDNMSYTAQALAVDLGLSKSTIHRFLKALYKLGVVTGTELPKLSDEYYRVLAKYLLGKKEEKGGKSG